MTNDEWHNFLAIFVPIIEGGQVTIYRDRG